MPENNKLTITIEEVITNDIIGYQISEEITPHAEGEPPPITLCLLGILLTKTVSEALKLVIGPALSEGEGGITSERIAEAAEIRDAVHAQSGPTRGH